MAVIHVDSSIPMKTKRTVLTQEMLNIMLHYNKYITSWDAVLNHLKNFMRKMKYSEYGKSVLYDAAQSATNIYGRSDSVLATTPKGKLKRMYQEMIRRIGIRIKVVEQLGKH